MPNRTTSNGGYSWPTAIARVPVIGRDNPQVSSYYLGNTAIKASVLDTQRWESKGGAAGGRPQPLYGDDVALVGYALSAGHCPPSLMVAQQQLLRTKDFPFRTYYMRPADSTKPQARELKVPVYPLLVEDRDQRKRPQIISTIRVTDCALPFLEHPALHQEVLFSLDIDSPIVPVRVLSPPALLFSLLCIIHKTTCHEDQDATQRSTVAGALREQPELVHALRHLRLFFALKRRVPFCSFANFLGFRQLFTPEMEAMRKKITEDLGEVLGIKAAVQAARAELRDLPLFADELTDEQRKEWAELGYVKGEVGELAREYSEAFAEAVSLMQTLDTFPYRELKASPYSPQNRQGPLRGEVVGSKWCPIM
ncbi:hypothetical protein JCM10213_002964 [Rhodosporidiobolus nylandii]